MDLQGTIMREKSVILIRTPVSFHPVVKDTIF